MIPKPRSPFAGRWYEAVRYEDGAWPLYRWDRNVQYLTKSLVHRRTPWTSADRDHAQRARDYLESCVFLGDEKPSNSKGISNLSEARLVLGGDLMWVRRGFERALSSGLRARIEAADVAIANLESPVVPELPVPTYTYETLRYNAPPTVLEAWQSPKPRVLSLCNNHALDQGLEGLARTREIVTRHGIHALGGTEEGDEGTSFVARGIRFAALGVTYGINHTPRSKNGLLAHPAGVPVARFGDPTSTPDFARLARQLEALGPADVRVLVAHWGFEYEYFPSELQREHARALFALGFDVIVGSSPHVLQPVEIVSIDGADPACPMQVVRPAEVSRGPSFGLVAWSLGNLCTIMPTLACRVGALVELDVRLGPSGSLRFAGLRAIPTVSARGLAGDWLAGATLSLDEVEDLTGRGEPCRASRWPCRAHAESVLGTLAQRRPDVR